VIGRLRISASLLEMMDYFKGIKAELVPFGVRVSAMHVNGMLEQQE
jgi:hypothetical protein